MSDSYSIGHSHDHGHDAAEAGPGLRLALKTALLLGLGVYFAYVVFSDNLKNYTHPQFAWLAVLAAVFLLVLGLVSGYEMMSRRRARTPEDEEHDHEHPHEHVHHHHVSWAVLGVVAIPLVLGVIVPSRPLGAAAMNNSNLAGPSLQVEGSGTYSVDPPEWNIMEWQLAFKNQMHPNDWFTGKEADLIGFVVHRPDIPAEHFVAARFVMYHCAADARGVGLLVNWPQSRELAQDSWVRAQGTMQVKEVNGEPVLTLVASQVETVPEPELPYLRPFIRSEIQPGD